MLAVPSWHTHPRHLFAFGFACGSYFQALLSGHEARNRLLFIYFIFLKKLWLSLLCLPPQNWNSQSGEEIQLL